MNVAPTRVDANRLNLDPLRKDLRRLRGGWSSIGRNVHHGNDRIVHDVTVDHGVLERHDARLPGIAADPPTDALQRRRSGRRGRDLRGLPEPFAPRGRRARRGGGRAAVPIEGRVRGQTEPSKKLPEGVGDRRRGRLLARWRLQDVERQGDPRPRGWRFRDHVEGRGGGRGGRGGGEQQD